jgi:hypothetical protein
MVHLFNRFFRDQLELKFCIRKLAWNYIELLSSPSPLGSIDFARWSARAPARPVRTFAASKQLIAMKPSGRTASGRVGMADVAGKNCDARNKYGPGEGAPSVRKLS